MSDVKQPWPPGIWDIGDENNRCCEVTIDLEGGAQVALSLHRCDSVSRSEEYVITREEMLAIAHLVKEAPAMAEALAAFVVGFDDAWRRSGRGGPPVYPPVVERARAVLDAAGWSWSR